MRSPHGCGPRVRPQVKVGTAASRPSLRPGRPSPGARASRAPWAPCTRGPKLRPRSDDRRCLPGGTVTPADNRRLTSIFASLRFLSRALVIRSWPVGL